MRARSVLLEALVDVKQSTKGDLNLGTNSSFIRPKFPINPTIPIMLQYVSTYMSTANQHHATRHARTHELDRTRDTRVQVDRFAVLRLGASE